MGNYPALGQFDKLPFGKYKGHFVGTVCEDDPGWLDWALNNTQLRIDEGALKYLEECKRG